MQPKSTHSCGQNQEEKPLDPRILESENYFMRRVRVEHISSCQPYPPQTGTGLKRLSNFKVKAFLNASVDNIKKMSVL